MWSHLFTFSFKINFLHVISNASKKIWHSNNFQSKSISSILWHFKVFKTRQNNETYVPESNLSDALSISFLLTLLDCHKHLCHMRRENVCKSSTMTLTVTVSQRVCTQLVLLDFSLVLSIFIYLDKICEFHWKIDFSEKDKLIFISSAQHICNGYMEIICRGEGYNVNVHFIIILLRKKVM